MLCYVQFMTDLDLISCNILRALESDGRISNIDLAARVGLSPSACLRRVQELERTGLIKGYRAILVMSEIQSLERRQILSALGAQLELTPAALGTAGARQRLERNCWGNPTCIQRRLAM